MRLILGFHTRISKGTILFCNIVGLICLMFLMSYVIADAYIITHSNIITHASFIQMSVHPNTHSLIYIFSVWLGGLGEQHNNVTLI